MTNQTPCEIIVWHILPAIRRELAKNMIKRHGLSQKEVAKKLGLTEAAISRYLSGKRAYLNMPNGQVKKEIIKSVDNLVSGKNTTVIMETCRICDILKATGVINNIDKFCVKK
jgi:predicted transcriptional regulator